MMRTKIVDALKSTDFGAALQKYDCLRTYRQSRVKHQKVGYAPAEETKT
jgi:hypothetical protein